MPRFVIAVLFAVVLTAPAAALEVQTCDDAGVGLAELLTPIGESVRTFAEDTVRVFSVYKGEPICCGAGIAVALPDPVHGEQCLAVVGFSSVDLPKAEVTGDPAKELSISVPARYYEQQDEVRLKLRINADEGSVKLD